MGSYWRFISQQWPLLGFGFLTVFWGNLGQSFFISWFGVSIQQTFAISAADYGLFYAVATLCSGLLIMALGSHIDRLPLKVFTTLVAGGLMTACLLLSQASTLYVFAVALFLLRLCGQGLMPHTAQTTMARYFSTDRGKALSISASGVPVGEIVLPLLAVALIAAFGWQYSWFLLALSIPLIYGPLMVVLFRKSALPRSLPIKQQSVNHVALSRRHVLADQRFWLILPALLSGPFIVTGLFIQQHYLLSEKSWSTSLLAGCFVLYGVMHWFSAMWAGVLVDRYSARQLIRFIMLPLFVALLLLASCNGIWLAPVFMSMLGLAIGIAHPVFGALWAEIYGVTNIGAIRSLATAIMMFATAAAPWIFGIFIDKGIAGGQFFSGVVLIVIVAAVCAWLAYPKYLPLQNE
jgi:predicted MFS family arabinose efflux permease